MSDLWCHFAQVTYMASNWAACPNIHFSSVYYLAHWTALIERRGQLVLFRWKTSWLRRLFSCSPHTCSPYLRVFPSQNKRQEHLPVYYHGRFPRVSLQNAGKLWRCVCSSNRWRSSVNNRQKFDSMGWFLSKTDPSLCCFWSVADMTFPSLQSNVEEIHARLLAYLEPDFCRLISIWSIPNAVLLCFEFVKVSKFEQLRKLYTQDHLKNHRYWLNSEQLMKLFYLTLMTTLLSVLSVRNQPVGNRRNV